MTTELVKRGAVLALLWLALTLSAVGIAGASQKPKFVLVHGAWHVGSAWDGVISELQKMGYDAEAITLAGHGENADRKEVTLADSEKILLDNLSGQTEPVILVGHSAAGVLLQHTSGKISEKLAAVVFHNAFLIPDGTSLFEALPPDVAKAFEAAAAASADNSIGVDEGFWRNVLLAGVEEAQATEIIAQMVPQPFGYYTSKIDSSTFTNLESPKFILLATDDNSLPQEAWKGMATLAGESTTIEISGGHEVLLTDPEAVARGLAEIASKVDSR